MNDDFLKRYRKPPPRAFAHSLARRLHLTSRDPRAGTMKGRPMSRLLTPLAIAAAALIAITVLLIPNGTPVTLTQIDIAPLLSDLAPLTTENVDQLTEVARIGSGTISEVVWSPDGMWLAVAGARGVFLYDDTLSDAPIILASNQAIYYQSNIAFHPDSRHLAVADGEMIRIWDVLAGVQIGMLETGGLYVGALNFSHDGTLLAAALNSPLFSTVNVSYSVAVWRWADAALVFENDVDQGFVTDVAFSPDDSSLIASDDRHIFIVDLRDDTRRTLPITARNGASGLAVAPDGTRIAFGSNAGFGIWTLDSDDTLAEVTVPNHYQGVAAPPFVTDLAYTPDGSQLVIASLNGGVSVWDIASASFTQTEFGTPEHTFPNVNSLAIHPDGERFALVRADSRVEMWTLDGEKIGERTDAGERIFNMAFSSDGVTLATSSYGSVIRLWDITTGRETAQIETNSGYVTAFAFSPDGTTLAHLYTTPEEAPYSDIALYDVASGMITRTLSRSLFSANDIQALAFNADGTRLYGVHGTNSRVQMWDLTQPDETDPVIVYRPGQRIGSALALAPDESQLATIVGADHEPVLVDLMVSDGASSEGMTLPALTDTMRLVFRPDGSELAAMSRQDVMVWRLPTLETVMRVSLGANTYLHDIAYAPVGNLLFTTQDDVFTAWDTTEGGRVLYESPAQGIHRLAISADQRVVVTGGLDGMIRV
jgi:WD40 repeat protein